MQYTFRMIWQQDTKFEVIYVTIRASEYFEALRKLEFLWSQKYDELSTELITETLTE